MLLRGSSTPATAVRPALGGLRAFFSRAPAQHSGEIHSEQKVLKLRTQFAAALRVAVAARTRTQSDLQPTTGFGTPGRCQNWSRRAPESHSSALNRCGVGNEEGVWHLYHDSQAATHPLPEKKRAQTRLVAIRARFDRRRAVFPPSPGQGPRPPAPPTSPGTVTEVRSPSSTRVQFMLKILGRIRVNQKQHRPHTCSSSAPVSK